MRALDARGARTRDARRARAALRGARALDARDALDELERYRSGQTGQTVNLLAQPSEVRILPSPPTESSVGRVRLVLHEVGIDERGEIEEGFGWKRAGGNSSAG